MRYNITQLNDFNIFKQLENLLKIFLEKLFNNLNTHD